MSDCTFGLRSAALSMTAWAACVIAAVYTPIPASAADRLVLCEEYTNRW